MRWSYKTVHFEMKKEGLLGGPFFDENEMEERLNEYGHAGWELVSLLEIKDGVIGVLKQPISLTGSEADWEEQSQEPSNASYDYIEAADTEASFEKKSSPLPAAEPEVIVVEGDETEEGDVGAIRIE